MRLPDDNGFSRAEARTTTLPWSKLRAPAGGPLAAENARNALGRRLACSRAVLATCHAFEWVAFGYLGLTSALIVVFHRNLPTAALHLLLQIGVAALTATLCWAAERWRWPALVLARHWYPQAFFLFCFEELNFVVHLIFPGWFDGWLIAFDHWVVGVHPTVWFQQFARPALNDFMQMSYITYFFYLTILAGILYVRRELRAFWTVMTCSVISYTTGYLISILFPIESPHHALAALHQVELTGGFFTSLIGLVELFGRVHGAAFPSSHVSGALVAVLGARRYRRWLYWIYVPFFLCMMVSTVYGRYHYLADVLGGLVVGSFGWWAGDKLMRHRRACPQPPEPSE